MKIAVVSGGFDPVHSGHIDYFNAARKSADHLIVLLNSDAWLERKKEKAFMPFDERKKILENLTMVNEVIGFDDDENGSCKDGLRKVKSKYPRDKIYFCNGGDRTRSNIPEMDIEGINFLFGIGGSNKKNSSSWILKDWKYKSEERIWGTFYNLFEDSKVKVKEIIIQPNKGMSLQRHFHRNEVWYVAHGSCKVNFSKTSPEVRELIELNEDDIFNVYQGDWHQLINESDHPCHIIEIQYGSVLSEEDIERHSYYDKN